ncbi:hypothetical protein RJ639_000972 [Escallonia herrerae]|uniref:Uncharacterized protein n=1 Tax=Escallonia herrerae TaxID=1293975 RepID=A0AA88XR13_9ASTE|nr:hypothetical protein RJ639_000972 [Escallonia herrerae]
MGGMRGGQGRGATAEGVPADNLLCEREGDEGRRGEEKGAAGRHNNASTPLELTSKAVYSVHNSGVSDRKAMTALPIQRLESNGLALVMVHVASWGFGCRGTKELDTIVFNMFLDPNLPPLPETTDNDSDETKAARKKREDDELVCKGHILNALSNHLYDQFTSSKCPREIWKALENKYNNEKQGTDKFLTLKYFEFTMNDSESVMDQQRQLRGGYGDRRRVDWGGPLVVTILVAGFGRHRRFVVHVAPAALLPCMLFCGGVVLRDVVNVGVSGCRNSYVGGSDVLLPRAACAIFAHRHLMIFRLFALRTVG